MSTNNNSLSTNSLVLVRTRICGNIH